MVRGMPETKMELAKKAVIMLLYGIEPMQNETLEDYVRRGSRLLRETAKEERYVDESY